MSDMEQRTDDWYAARLGKVTASSLYKVLAKTKTGYGADRGNYMTQLVLERVTGSKADSYTNAAMQWGIDQEPFARAAYEACQGNQQLQARVIAAKKARIERAKKEKANGK